MPLCYNVHNMTQTTTMTIRIDKKAEQALKEIAKQERRSKSFIAAEALRQYLDLHTAQVEGIKKALASVERGGILAHCDVKDWVNSWGTGDELPTPAPTPHQ